MGAFSGVSQFFNRPLDSVATEFGYGADNILILQGREQELRTAFPGTYRNIRSCIQHADRRTPLAYAQDLVASWLIEDFFLKILSSEHYTITLSGADQGRKILESSRTSASSDFLITTPTKQIRLELMNDYTGFWRRREILHLRNDKYIRLKETGSLFIAVATPSNEFALFDFRGEIPARYIPSHQPYGGKPAYEIQIPFTLFQPITAHGIEQSILQLL